MLTNTVISNMNDYSQIEDNINQSFLYHYFNELINTAMCFQNKSFQAYLTIKNYAYNFIIHNIKTQQGCLSQFEQMEFEKSQLFFNQEINSIGGFSNAVLSKENFESFLVQSFSTIDFDQCDKTTLTIANNLITVLSSYGPLPERFANHKNFLMYKLSQLNNNVGNVFESKNDSSKKNNQGSNLVNNKAKPEPIKTNPEQMKSTNVNNLIDRSISLPVKKGTPEFKKLQDIIKEHIMYAEQEALYNKIDHSRAHIETALYYLKNVIE